MIRRYALAWVLAILAVTPSLAQIPFSRDLVPKRSAMARLGLERHWMALVPIFATERLLSISLAGNMLFAQTNMANFYAYDAESGRLLWTTHLGRETRAAQPASVNSRLVFVTNSNELYALERPTGRVVWVQNMEALPTSSTACDEQHVMVGLSNGKLVAFDLYAAGDKTKALYEVPRASWNWQTGGGSLTSRPLPAQQFVAFGGRDGRLYVALSELPSDLMAVLLLPRRDRGRDLRAAGVVRDTDHPGPLRRQEPLCGRPVLRDGEMDLSLRCADHAGALDGRR